jgi:hypothetical protein
MHVQAAKNAFKHKGCGNIYYPYAILPEGAGQHRHDIYYLKPTKLHTLDELLRYTQVHLYGVDLLPIKKGGGRTPPFQFPLQLTSDLPLKIISDHEVSIERKASSSASQYQRKNSLSAALIAADASTS